MYLPLPTPAEMATWDRETIDTIGIPGVTLMESASREAVSVLIDEYGPVEDAEIFCFAGSGNNGGDAFAMARQLMDLGADVTVFHTKPKKQYRGETRTNLLWAQKLGVPLRHLHGVDINALPTPDIIIDGVLGTGFQGELRPDTLALIQAINRLGDNAYVMSVDIPSGLNGLTGQPQPDAVVADATVTFQAAKLGLAMPGANRYTGMLHVQPIGIPNQIQESNPAQHHLISGDIMELIPSPTHDMHKGTAGHILIVGGSIGLTGAPHLAALGALRSGSGLVTVACPGALADSIKGNRPDIMTLPLGKGEKWNVALAASLLKEVSRFDAVVIGPGLGRAHTTVAFLKAFLKQCPENILFDADALYCLSKLNDYAALPASTILTPHPGEMATLTGLTNQEVQEDRLTIATDFGQAFPGTLVLKGAGTIVAGQNRVCLSPFSEANLAIGGSGDVLSGIIASLMARGLDAHTAACLGVYWHGATGRLLREEFPVRGNLASEIANMLPITVKEYLPC